MLGHLLVSFSSLLCFVLFIALSPHENNVLTDIFLLIVQDRYYLLLVDKCKWENFIMKTGILWATKHFNSSYTLSTCCIYIICKVPLGDNLQIALLKPQLQALCNNSQVSCTILGFDLRCKASTNNQSSDCPAAQSSDCIQGSVQSVDESQLSQTEPGKGEWNHVDLH